MYIPYNGAQRLKSFFTASLYFCRFSSVSPSFFSLSIESLYSCTAGCPSSSSLVPSSTSSFAPSGRMRRRVSRTLFWDGLSSHSYSSISARVFSCSHASVFCKTVLSENDWLINWKISAKCSVCTLKCVVVKIMTMIAAIVRLYNMTQIKLGKDNISSLLHLWLYGITFNMEKH